ncbi:glutathione S-transferase [Annulohypoxylon truncatum]|uniref:glutathione S-transferase n=1 Tax=Annulohypoxylon truncatum TaxID=327061 RepID=UPI002007ACDC|nr:glutathione S-transferase [Annulohypoxylon truncatum]KAI1205647.1 glutathione S-transferase [Annulohypoxylon truncatum]
MIVRPKRLPSSFYITFAIPLRQPSSQRIRFISHHKSFTRCVNHQCFRSMSQNTKIEYQKDGHFTRPASTFRNFVSADPKTQFPAEKGRYALYISPGCPWAHRTIIVRALKRLEDVIDLYILSPSMGEKGWFFDGAHGTLPKDPLYGFTYLRELYFKANPDFDGRFTVPVLWDKKAGTIVNNESSEIIRMLYCEFDAFIPEQFREVNKPGGGLYPEHLRKDIDELNEWVYDTVNNGVYKCGFATKQESYDQNVYPLFKSLDRLESLLATQGKPFLFGDQITEADIRLYTTIARFDVAYYPVFLCNLKSIRHDYPHLHLWFRRLYWDESAITGGAFHKTTEPWIGLYSTGYSTARNRVTNSQAAVIVPRGPAVLVEPLAESEKLKL